MQGKTNPTNPRKGLTSTIVILESLELSSCCHGTTEKQDCTRYMFPWPLLILDIQPKAHGNASWQSRHHKKVKHRCTGTARVTLTDQREVDSQVGELNPIIERGDLVMLKSLARDSKRAGLLFQNSKQVVVETLVEGSPCKRAIIIPVFVQRMSSLCSLDCHFDKSCFSKSICFVVPLCNLLVQGLRKDSGNKKRQDPPKRQTWQADKLLYPLQKI